MNNDNELVRGRLEEQVLHVAEQYIDLGSAIAVDVAKTILVNFDASRNALSIQCWSDEDEVEDMGFAAYILLASCNVKKYEEHTYS